MLKKEKKCDEQFVPLVQN